MSIGVSLSWWIWVIIAVVFFCLSLTGGLCYRRIRHRGVIVNQTSNTGAAMIVTTHVPPPVIQPAHTTTHTHFNAHDNKGFSAPSQPYAAQPNASQLYGQQPYQHQPYHAPAMQQPHYAPPHLTSAQSYNPEPLPPSFYPGAVNPTAPPPYDAKY